MNICRGVMLRPRSVDRHRRLLRMADSGADKNAEARRDEKCLGGTGIERAYIDAMRGDGLSGRVVAVAASYHWRPAALCL